MAEPGRGRMRFLPGGAFRPFAALATRPGLPAARTAGLGFAAAWTSVSRFAAIASVSAALSAIPAAHADAGSSPGTGLPVPDPRSDTLNSWPKAGSRESDAASSRSHGDAGAPAPAISGDSAGTGASIPETSPGATPHGSAGIPGADTAALPDPPPEKARGFRVRSDSPAGTDSLERRVRLLNAITGSTQKADPPRWRKRDPYPGAPLLLTLPAGELPYGLDAGFDSPGMRQSLMLSAAATQWADQTIEWLWSGAESRFVRNLGTYACLGAFTYYFSYLPLGDPWLHEEWHRAVLSRRGISSHNGIYDFRVGVDAIAVNGVRDRDLAALKDRHPADFVRLMEAGMEGEVESVRLMRRRNFFLGRPASSDLIAWWTSGLTVTSYLWICSGDGFDASLRRMNREESDPRDRDFTGLDFRAWVHDLRRPDEAYASGPRGRPHPTGTGFDRYLLDADMTSGERRFLRLQSGLSLLNLVSGQHFGRDWLPGRNPWNGQGYLWNFGFTHHLAPFGYAVGGEFLARQGKAEWVFTAQGLANASLALPCLGAELFRYPVPLGRKPVYLSATLSAWLQPEDLRFRAGSAEPGAYGLLGAAIPLAQNLEVFAEADAKTAGWVPGVVYLDAAAEGRAGIQIRL